VRIGAASGVAPEVEFDCDLTTAALTKVFQAPVGGTLRDASPFWQPCKRACLLSLVSDGEWPYVMQPPYCMGRHAEGW
jgi:hypothetical protein